MDRKKDLVKLQHGEYVSLSKVESELKTCPLVDNICVYADSTRKFVVALLMPNTEKLMNVAHESNHIIYSNYLIILILSTSNCFYFIQTQVGVPWKKCVLIWWLRN